LSEVNTKTYYYIGFALLGLGLLVFYKTYNPEVHSYFPKCPFLSLTGLQCPGCGSQRAVHHLLNGHFVNAFKQNALLLLAMPYVLLGLFLEFKKPLSKKLLNIRKRFFGSIAIWCILGIIFTFWIFRNLML
tara:strand:- start:579 stop:971 length:393 start_codon:yes stop_codon:yes gene_type:complete